MGGCPSRTSFGRHAAVRGSTWQYVAVRGFRGAILAFQMPERGAGPSHQRSGALRPSRHARMLLLTFAVLVMAAMAFVMFSGFWIDWLWYRSVGYSSAFSTTIAARLGLFSVFGLGAGAAV